MARAAHPSHQKRKTRETETKQSDRDDAEKGISREQAIAMGKPVDGDVPQQDEREPAHRA